MTQQMDELEHLNPRQQEAVVTTDGPVLILAGPGSGKTKVLTHRIAHIVQKGVPPENILAVTFTNKAANEMKDRIHKITQNSKFPPRRGEARPMKLGGKIQNLFVGTFHAFAVRILRAHAAKIGYQTRFTIFDDDDSLSLVKETMKELEINPKQFAPGMIAKIISSLKNELTSPEEYAERTDIGELFPKTVHTAYAEYQRRLRTSNAMDFDDLLMNTCTLFKNYPEVLAQYQDRFRYINVDEWQDTNHAQYVMMHQLAQKHGNIAVVGDDAQSIYAFRGADFRNVLNFEKDWPSAKIIVLDQNYRSTQPILDAAREIISRNKLQKEKKLWTERKEGEPLTMRVVGDERGEAEYVVDEIERNLQQGLAPKDAAILYRTNAQSRVLEEVLLERDVPYTITGGIKFYQRKEIKDILAYIRVIMNPSDTVSLKRIINVPARGIGNRLFLAYLTGRDSLSEKQKKLLDAFDTTMSGLRKEIKAQKLTFFFKNLLKKIEYKVYLDDDSDRAEERWENVEELVSLAKKYDELGPPEGAEKMLEDVTLMSDADTVETGNNSVNLMTFHAAKGLEFPIVFMVGLEEGVLPHSRALFNPAELEEERRLCYVGLTRAKEKVYLSCALRRTHFGSVQANPPSRFLSEIPERLIKVDEEGIEEITLD